MARYQAEVLGALKYKARRWARSPRARRPTLHARFEHCARMFGFDLDMPRILVVRTEASARSSRATAITTTSSPTSRQPSTTRSCVKQLQDVARDEIERLMVPMPPGHGKLSIARCVLPHGIWATTPSTTWCMRPTAIGIAKGKAILSDLPGTPSRRARSGL